MFSAILILIISLLQFFGKNKIPKAVRNELDKTTTIIAAKTAKQPRKPPAVRKEYRKERKERKTKAALKV